LNTLKHIILNQWAKLTLSKWKKDCKNPKKMYENGFKYIQQHTRQKQILTLKNFQDLRKLPLTDYSDYKALFKDSLETEINTLNGEKVHFWATSTGSTDTPKTFPITTVVDESTKIFQKVRASLLIKHLKIWSNKPELIFVLPGEQQSFKPKLLIGQIGYYFQKQTPKWLEKQFIFSKSLYQDKDTFDKWHVVAALLSDCSGITTSIPARLTFFLNHIKANQDQYKSIIEQGDFPKTHIKFYSKKRIKYIIKVLEHPIKSITELWPSLTFVCSWHSGESCNKQLQELKRNIDFSGVKFIDQIFNSSEDIFNIPLINEVGGPLNLYNHIIEFYDSKTDTFYWPWDLKEGGIYELVITNTMGLTRYRIYDNVMCTGFFENTPKIAFHSRNIPEISLGWCTIAEKQLIQSITSLKDNIPSTYYFSLNEKGNGLDIVSYKNELKFNMTEINENLKALSSNYKKQLDLGNVTPLKFRLISEKEYHQMMLNNSNSKRFFLK
jgi:hypothetical protein